MGGFGMEPALVGVAGACRFAVKAWRALVRSGSVSGSQFVRLWGGTAAGPKVGSARGARRPPLGVHVGHALPDPWVEVEQPRVRQKCEPDAPYDVTCHRRGTEALHEGVRLGLGCRGRARRGGKRPAWTPGPLLPLLFLFSMVRGSGIPPEFLSSSATAVQHDTILRDSVLSSTPQPCCSWPRNLLGSHGCFSRVGTQRTCTSPCRARTYSSAAALARHSTAAGSYGTYMARAAALAACRSAAVRRCASAREARSSAVRPEPAALRRACVCISNASASSSYSCIEAQPKGGSGETCRKDVERYGRGQAGGGSTDPRDPARLPGSFEDSRGFEGRIGRIRTRRRRARSLSTSRPGKRSSAAWWRCPFKASAVSTSWT